MMEGFIADITDKKDANLKPQKNGLQLRMSIEQAGNAFFVHDYEGRLLELNRRACETLGFNRGELLRIKVSDIDIEVAEVEYCRFHTMLLTGACAGGECDVRASDSTCVNIGL